MPVPDPVTVYLLFTGIRTGTRFQPFQISTPRDLGSSILIYQYEHIYSTYLV